MNLETLPKTSNINEGHHHTCENDNNKKTGRNKKNESRNLLCLPFERKKSVSPQNMKSKENKTKTNKKIVPVFADSAVFRDVFFCLSYQ